ncbi:olfactory receptor 11A1 [Chelonia mydas]|uniref:olfactory receptor 11A1 n=1 Tax=Chelonia mydas TaxID=8469 RepID=UPI001CA81D67|nr:olfactory receptor 11A1 [Chelonia mydas]
MASAVWSNKTATEFILMGFGDLPELQILLFLPFSVIYILTMVGNILIITLIVTDQHLHTPMYFFLGNLSCLETCYTSTILPRLLASLLTAVIDLSCSDTRLIKLLGVVLAGVCSLPPSLLTVTSYICIITSILRIPSTTGRQKAFSTCSSHLIVITTFYGTLIIVYLLPKTKTLQDLNKVFSIFYTILTPLLNPFIYSLRNKEVKKALRKAVSKFTAFTRI